MQRQCSNTINGPIRWYLVRIFKADNSHYTHQGLSQMLAKVIQSNHSGLFYGCCQTKKMAKKMLRTLFSWRKNTLSQVRYVSSPYIKSVTPIGWNDKLPPFVSVLNVLVASEKVCGPGLRDSLSSHLKEADLSYNEFWWSLKRFRIK